MKKLIAVLTLAMATAVMAPRPVAAEDGSCTDNYVKCLNDTWYLTGWLQTMADIECFAEYTGCVKRSIMKA
jgi:hypothetical protein